MDPPPEPEGTGRNAPVFHDSAFLAMRDRPAESTLLTGAQGNGCCALTGAPSFPKREPKDADVMRKGFGMSFQGTGSRAPVLLVFTVAAFAMFFATEPARADFRVCNATQSLVGVSIGYRAKSGWITEGWWHVDASSCKTIIEGPLSSRYYYLYAEDAERGGRWSGNINMCVAEKEFKVFGINDCFARGFQRAGFQEYDTGEQTSWMVQLSDEPAPSSGDDTGTGNQ